MRYAIAGTLLITCAGCDLRTMDPNWNALWQHSRVATSPGDHHSASFIYDETDEDLKRAIPYLQKVKLTKLNLQDTKFTDESVPELLKLDTLETLSVQRTLFTVDGLFKLGAMPRLKVMYISGAQFSGEDIARVRAALPHVDVHDARISFAPATHPSSVWDAP